MKKSLNIYVYDGSFSGLLVLIKYLFQNSIFPLNIKSTDYNFSLFDSPINLNLTNNDDIIMEFIKKTNVYFFNTCFNIYLSNDNNKEIVLYKFFLCFIKYGNNTFYMRKFDSINKALKIDQYVRRENHKFKGFVRFKELKNGILYAEISPENNIIFILAKHFKQRLKKEKWIIKDVKRNIVCYYDGHLNFYDGNTLNISLDLNINENEYVDMWKSFYDTIGIKERKNERCRMNFMPKKYWKYIVEMSDKI